MVEPVVLIDVMNLVFRMHYSHRNLSSEGQSTGVQYGVLKTICDLRENVSERLVFCWDHGIPMPGAERPRNWRDAIIKTYKATRPKNPDYPIVVAQLFDLSRAIEMLGYQNVAVMGLEADDIIGLISRQIKNDVLIFSTDWDMYQLIDGKRVQILVPKKSRGQFKRLSERDIEREHGLKVAEWASYLAMGGDKSDNIKPARGMGPKTAIKMVKDGAMPWHPFNYQHEAFQETWSKYEAAWPDIMASYRCARIPTTLSDERIRHMFPSMRADLVSRLHGPWSQHWGFDIEKRRSIKAFRQFCADRDMGTLTMKIPTLFGY